MFFTKYVEKMLLITGIGTSAALAYAFFPQWLSTTLANCLTSSKISSSISTGELWLA
ncbi:hypothetical protein JCM19240_831 [Vibrio maritimus]|uniref:Uncharacterized protein n=1 Tax=Vibrio maritimus TaxID=990268 RepID=A0A090T3Z5_9VIBR|nr:hypothetical protein JCM19240_831 [Vibrio maritimus]